VSVKGGRHLGAADGHGGTSRGRGLPVVLKSCEDHESDHKCNDADKNAGVPPPIAGAASFQVNGVFKLSSFQVFKSLMVNPRLNGTARHG